MMRALFLSIFSILSISLAAIGENAEPGGRVLVLVDDMAIQKSHSSFFDLLTSRGHKLTFKSADDASLALFEFGELVYDHLVLFCPTVEEFGGSLNVAEITKFIDQGGNVLMAADSTAGDLIREIANEVNFEIDEAKSNVIDHFHFDPILDDGHHTTLVVEAGQFVKAPYIVGEPSAYAPVLYKGVGLVLEKPSPLTVQVAVASSTAYSYDPQSHISQYPNAVGKSTILIGAMQSRNNARVLIAGSLDLFSDRFFRAQVHSVLPNGEKKKTASGNEQLARSLADWTFKQKGVIRVKAVQHNKVGEKKSPGAYTIKDRAEFRIDVEEFKNGQWLPFLAPQNDMQMEFVRIDPFVRATLKADQKVKGRYGVQFDVPDVYGVYKFVVDYNRLGLTYLYSVIQVSVHPLEHTQFERFIRSAFPYYVSAFSMMVGVMIFSCVFLHFKEQPGKSD